MIHLKQFDEWLKNLGKAWVETNPQLLIDICAPDIIYYETPFSKPIEGIEAVKKQWQKDLVGQKEIKFNYDILAATVNGGVASWQAEFIHAKNKPKMVLAGIFYVELNHQGLCALFRQWYQAR